MDSVLFQHVDSSVVDKYVATKSASHKEKGSLNLPHVAVAINFFVIC